MKQVEQTPPARLRLMSFNIQHGYDYASKSGIHLEKMAEVIRALDPDIVGLNEVRGRGRSAEYTAQAEELGALLGYHAWFGRSIYVGGTEPYGNAVLSKLPILSAAVHAIPDPIPRGKSVESRSILRAEFELGGQRDRRFAVYVSHFGLSQAEHEHAVSTAVTLLCEEPLPFALMGDFNMVPEDPLLTPLFDALHSTSPHTDGQLCFPSDAPDEKIDYIFVSQKVRVCSAAIPAVIASDHRPIYADIEF